MRNQSKFKRYKILLKILIGLNNFLRNFTGFPFTKLDVPSYSEVVKWLHLTTSKF